jgi:hypothetical protein
LLEPVPDPADYIQWGKDGVLALVEDQLAVVWPEVEARIADARYVGIPSRIDPNHLQTAREQLLLEGLIVEHRTATRGGRTIPVLVPAEQRRKKRAIEQASSRKRLLYARYLGWSAGTPGHHGVIGRALEMVVHDSLMSAAPYHGYRLENPDDGQTTALCGARLPRGMGALDNAYSYIGWSDDRRLAVPVEAKNLRDWIFPASQELYQLLFKAAILQTQLRGDIDLLPVLVCRRAHKTLFRMAKDLGFHVVATRHQFIRPGTFVAEAARRHLDEVRAGLGFHDLLMHETSHPSVFNQFRSVLPRVIGVSAERWRDFGSQFGVEYEQLWKSQSFAERRKLVGRIKKRMRSYPDPYGDIRDDRGW